MKQVAALFLLGFCALDINAQCAPGIPGAGNPGCIPPNQPNSPYSTGNNSAPSAPQPRWEDRWGAIAMDPHTGRAGTVSGETSKARATRAALDKCSANGGNQCEISLSYFNQCAAIAQDSGGGPIYSVSAPQKDRAESMALSNCGKEHGSCEIVYKACSLAEQADN